MDLKQLVLVLRRRWITVVAMLLAGLAIASFVSWRMTTEYESRARIFISVDVRNNSDLYAVTLFLSGRVASYADLATATNLLEEVIDTLDLDLTVDELRGRIHAELVTNTTLLDITVRDPDPKVAQSIARVESEGLTDLLTTLETSAGSASTRIIANVTDPADYNPDPVSPHWMLNLPIGAIIGLLLGVGAAFARDLLDRSLTSLHHVQEFTDAPVLASVPHDREIDEKPLLTDLGGFAPRTESFRMLRTNLQFLGLDQQPKSLVVTSATANEGKTMTSVNLGVALSQAGRKVLLIDGDLRRPRVPGVLGLDASTGLTTVLLGQVELAEAIQVHEPTGLHVLASGGRPPNPTEILQSRLTNDLIRTVSADYDMVIIDAPPLLPVADASVIATLADGAILVVRHGTTSRDQAAEAVSRLEQVGGHLSGIVVNMVPRRVSKNYYYYYGDA